jgi:hypothetical protein
VQLTVGHWIDRSWNNAQEGWQKLKLHYNELLTCDFDIAPALNI